MLTHKSEKHTEQFSEIRSIQHLIQDKSPTQQHAKTKIKILIPTLLII